MDIYEVVMKLIGPIDHIGDSSVDRRRFENLKELTLLTENLLADICQIENLYKNNYQASMKKASNHCADWMDAHGIERD